MNRLIVHIRIESYITGSIRKPVMSDFFPFCFLDPWNHTSIDHIMHISCNRNGNSCQEPCHRRHFLFPTGIFSSKTVSHHLMNQRKWHDKSKSCHKGSHQIICQFNSGSRKFGQEYCKILPTIIVVDFPS